MTSISRRNSDRTFTRRAAAKLRTDEPPKLRSAMTQSERQATEDWFIEARKAYVDNSVDLGMRIDLTPAGNEKIALEGEQGRLDGKRAQIDRKEEAFVAANSNQAMRAPSSVEIDRTRALASDLGKAIAEQKTAEAIAGLVDKLADLVDKVGQQTTV